MYIICHQTAKDLDKCIRNNPCLSRVDSLAEEIKCMCIQKIEDNA